jgi:hypothetical protein
MDDSNLDVWLYENEPPELGPDDDLTIDPIASFGIMEAQRHRSRGVTLSVFLGLAHFPFDRSMAIR